MESNKTQTILDYFSLDAPTGQVELAKKAEIISTEAPAQHGGFTLIELIIVLVIMGVVTGIAVPVFL